MGKVNNSNKVWHVLILCSGQHGVHGIVNNSNNSWHVLMFAVYSNNNQVTEKF